MFEIQKNDFMSFRMMPDRMKADPSGIYDFTFEGRYIIYHYRHQVMNHYIALDKTTGFGSSVMMTRERMDDHNYPMMIPAILYAIKYTGDRRMNMGEQIQRGNWIDMIFHCLLPQIGFSVREDQVRMANVMYNGLVGKKVTLCEAGVGTGKTMAYLTAAFVASRMDGTYRYAANPITISTSSIDLQREIMDKEIPRLSQVLQNAGILDRPLRAILRKGKEHYFCLRRYHDYVNGLMDAGERYSDTLCMLDMLNLPVRGFDLDTVQLPSYVKAKICASGSCRQCGYRNQCRYAQFLKQASANRKFDFQITNHNLLLTSQRLKNSTGHGVLLDSNYYIIDEAHQLLEAANSVYGAEITQDTIPDLLDSVKYAGKDKHTREQYRQLLARTLEKNADIFRNIGLCLDDGEDRCTIELNEQTIKDISGILENLRKIEGFQTDSRKKRGCKMVKEQLSTFTHPGDYLCWMEVDRGNGMLSLCGVPTAMRGNLNRNLWSMPNTHWVLTSGTMKDDTGFRYFKHELGISGNIPEGATLEHSNDSPFDYKNHTRLYISENVPFPDMDDPEYIQAVCDEIVKLVHATRGHTAILFTSYRMLRMVYEKVKKRLLDYRLIQMTRSDKTAIGQFKREKNSVLFASGSMWEGVDCAGDVLSSVIIVRLPFPLRSQLMEYKKTQYDTVREFVQECAIPQMIIKLRQGAGRLIRTENDTGVIAILDSRAAKNGPYRERVLTALSQYPLTPSIYGVEQFISAVKGTEYLEGGRASA